MNPAIIDMLKRKGVSAIAFVALGILICAESDQVRQLAIQFTALFGGTSAAMTALSVWLSLRKEQANAVEVVVAKFTPPPSAPTPKEQEILSQVAEKARVEAQK